ncbi:hypothetical protein D9M69_583110 [compost metagenome]
MNITINIQAPDRIDFLVAVAKAEINAMAEKAKAKILGHTITIDLPGVTDAREAREAAAAVRRAICASGRYI